MRRSFFVIANPGAGLSISPLTSTVTAALRTAGALVTTVRPGDIAATRAAARAAAACGRYDAVVAAGGDGTIRQVAAALMGTAMPLGIIPHGTGNVLAHEIGAPPGPAGITRMLLNGPACAIRCGYANREPFLLMASAGFDGRVIAGLNHRVKSYMGKAAYAAPVLAAMAHPVDALSVTIDGAEHEATWVIITNARHYGGHFMLTADHGIRSRCLQAVLFTARTRSARIGQIISLVRGKLDERAATRGDVKILPCTRATVTSQVPVPTQIDGDAFGSTPLEVEAGSVELQLLMPEPSGAALR